MGAVQFKTQDQLDQERLEAWRESCKVSRFQAKAALDHFGYLDQVEALMDDPETPRLTKMAWQDALEFRYMSPTVDSFCALLGIDTAGRDALFQFAEAVEA